MRSLGAFGRPSYTPLAADMTVAREPHKLALYTMDGDWVATVHDTPEGRAALRAIGEAIAGQGGRVYVDAVLPFDLPGAANA